MRIQTRVFYNDYSTRHHPSLAIPSTAKVRKTKPSGIVFVMSEQVKVVSP